MSGTVEVPGALVAWARRHYEREGCPLLFGPRSESDSAIQAEPFGDEYVLRFDADETEEAGYRVMLALDGMPDCFRCGDCLLGSYEAVEGYVRVDGPIALTCLSWLLAVRRAGFHLVLAG